MNRSQIKKYTLLFAVILLLTGCRKLDERTQQIIEIKKFQDAYVPAEPQPEESSGGMDYTAERTIKGSEELLFAFTLDQQIKAIEVIYEAVDGLVRLQEFDESIESMSDLMDEKQAPYAKHFLIISEEDLLELKKRVGEQKLQPVEVVLEQIDKEHTEGYLMVGTLKLDMFFFLYEDKPVININWRDTE